MKSSHNRQGAIEATVDKDMKTETATATVTSIGNAGNLEILGMKIIPGTSFIDDRLPITHGRR